MPLYTKPLLYIKCCNIYAGDSEPLRMLQETLIIIGSVLVLSVATKADLERGCQGRCKHPMLVLLYFLCFMYFHIPYFYSNSNFGSPSTISTVITLTLMILNSRSKQRPYCQYHRPVHYVGAVVRT